MKTHPEQDKKNIQPDKQMVFKTTGFACHDIKIKFSIRPALTVAKTETFRASNKITPTPHVGQTQRKLAGKKLPVNAASLTPLAAGEFLPHPVVTPGKRNEL